MFVCVCLCLCAVTQSPLIFRSGKRVIVDRHEVQPKQTPRELDLEVASVIRMVSRPLRTPQQEDVAVSVAPLSMYGICVSLLSYARDRL